MTSCSCLFVAVADNWAGASANEPWVKQEALAKSKWAKRQNCFTQDQDQSLYRGNGLAKNGQPTFQSGPSSNQKTLLPCPTSLLSLGLSWITGQVSQKQNPQTVLLADTPKQGLDKTVWNVDEKPFLSQSWQCGLFFLQSLPPTNPPSPPPEIKAFKIQPNRVVANQTPVISNCNFLKPSVHTGDAGIVRLLHLSDGSSTCGSTACVGQVALPCSAQQLPLSPQFSWQSTGAPICRSCWHFLVRMRTGMIAWAGAELWRKLPTPLDQEALWLPAHACNWRPLISSLSKTALEVCTQNLTFRNQQITSRNQQRACKIWNSCNANRSHLLISETLYPSKTDEF